jgi:hypothetical protein
LQTFGPFGLLKKSAETAKNRPFGQSYFPMFQDVFFRLSAESKRNFKINQTHCFLTRQPGGWETTFYWSGVESLPAASGSTRARSGDGLAVVGSVRTLSSVGGDGLDEVVLPRSTFHAPAYFRTRRDVSKKRYA